MNTADRGFRRPEPPDEDDPRYQRAREAYLKLLAQGRLACGKSCPLFAVGGCRTMCW